MNRQKSRLRKVLSFTGKSVAGVSLAAAFMSVAMQYTPELASSTAEDYLKDNSYPESVAQNYDTSRIRFYDRNNPLFVFHQAGRPIARFDDDPRPLIYKLLELPVRMAVAGKNAGMALMPSRQVEAFADPDPNGICFVRAPLEQIELKNFMANSAAIAGIAAPGKIVTENPQDVVADAFRTVVMAHEMRHCEQPQAMGPVNVRESDSDLKALRVLRQSGYDDAVVKEVYQLMVASRITVALTAGVSHDTGMSIMDGQVELFNSIVRTSAHETLVRLVKNVFANHRFPPDMMFGEGQYHAVQALLYNGTLHQVSKDVEDYAALYLKAYERLDKFADGRLITEKEYGQDINLEFFGRTTDQDLRHDLSAFGPAFFIDDAPILFLTFKKKSVRF